MKIFYRILKHSPVPLAKGESIRTLGAVMQGSNQFPEVFGHEAVQTSFYDFKYIMYIDSRRFHH